MCSAWQAHNFAIVTTNTLLHNSSSVMAKSALPVKQTPKKPTNKAKHNFQRVVVSTPSMSTSPIANKTSGSTNTSFNRVLAIRARPGIMGAYALKPTKNESSFLKPIATAFEKSVVIKQRLQANNNPRKIKSDSIIDHTIFLRILENEDDNTTPNMILWAQNIVQEFNKMAKHLQGYQWPTEFQYSGEFTAKPLSPISDFIVDEDTIKVIQATYSTIPLSDLDDNGAVIASFFGKGQDSAWSPTPPGLLQARHALQQRKPSLTKHLQLLIFLVRYFMSFLRYSIIYTVNRMSCREYNLNKKNMPLNLSWKDSNYLPIVREY
jgi:hypothetical protein